MCEQCRKQEEKALDDVQFAGLLAEGAVPFACPNCGQTTGWKVPPARRMLLKRTQGPLRILAIDDDEGTLKILRTMLQSKDCVVDVALSADEAISRLQELHFDVILADIRMPGFDGANLFRFLSVFLPEAVSRVVFLTGDRSEKTLRFLEESGCPYTFKPVNLKELKARIAEVA